MIAIVLLWISMSLFVVALIARKPQDKFYCYTLHIWLLILAVLAVATR